MEAAKVIEELESTDGRRWAFLSVLRIYDFEKPDDLYLWRLRIVSTPWFGIYLHKIVSDDGDRPEHDHPWPFVAVTVKGGYLDESGDEQRWRLPGRVHWHRATYRHTVRRLDRQRPAWTLVVVGRRVQRWGFWPASGWVYWKDFERPYKERAEGLRVLGLAREAHYVCTYCIHGQHDECRTQGCKQTGDPCRCPHPAEEVA